MTYKVQLELRIDKSKCIGFDYESDGDDKVALKDFYSKIKIVEMWNEFFPNNGILSKSELFIIFRKKEKYDV